MGGRNLEAGAGPMGAKLNAGAEPPGPIKFPEITVFYGNISGNAKAKCLKTAQSVQLTFFLLDLVIWYSPPRPLFNKSVFKPDTNFLLKPYQDPYPVPGSSLKIVLCTLYK